MSSTFIVSILKTKSGLNVINSFWDNIKTTWLTRAEGQTNEYINKHSNNRTNKPTDGNHVNLIIFT